MFCGCKVHLWSISQHVVCYEVSISHDFHCTVILCDMLLYAKSQLDDVISHVMRWCVHQISLIFDLYSHLLSGYYNVKVKKKCFVSYYYICIKAFQKYVLKIFVKILNTFGDVDTLLTQYCIEFCFCRSKTKHIYRVIHFEVQIKHQCEY